MKTKIIDIKLNTKAVTEFIVDMKLDGWEEISYVAVGALSDNNYNHIKVTNINQSQYVNFIYSPDSLAYRLQNDYQTNKKRTDIESIRLFIKGKVSNKEVTTNIKKLSIRGAPKTITVKESYCNGINLEGNDYKIADYRGDSKIIDAFHSYELKKEIAITELSTDFLQGKKTWLLNGNASVEGVDAAEIERQIQQDISMRYSYHALNHVNTLLTYYELKKDPIILEKSKELVVYWMDANYIKKTNDLKYAWYDHGVAERQIVLLRLWHLLPNTPEHKNFKEKIVNLIHEQADLLSSETWYVRDQNYRYHNHAVFQDIALLSTANYFSLFLEADNWAAIASSRLKEQLSNLTVEEDGYVVSIDNSSGYHEALLKLYQLVHRIYDSNSANNSGSITSYIEGMNKFHELIKYPNGNLPANGDTFRIANNKQDNSYNKINNSNSITLLKKSGYFIAQKSSGVKHLQFTQFATSLSQTHKHADNLSFTLYYDGVEWFADPSYYSYQYLDELPGFLRSVKAHNTAWVQDEEYRPYNGSTVFSNLAKNNNNNFFHITGTSSAQKGYEHKREVKANLEKLEFNIYDLIIALDKVDSKKNVVLGFQLGDNIEVRHVPGGLLLSSPLTKAQINVTLPGCMSLNKSKFPGSVSGLSFNEFVPAANYQCLLPIGEIHSWKISINN